RQVGRAPCSRTVPSLGLRSTSSGVIIILPSTEQFFFHVAREPFNLLPKIDYRDFETRQSLTAPRSLVLKSETVGPRGSDVKEDLTRAIRAEGVLNVCLFRHDLEISS